MTSSLHRMDLQIRFVPKHLTYTIVAFFPRTGVGVQFFRPIASDVFRAAAHSGSTRACPFAQVARSATVKIMAEKTSFQKRLADALDTVGYEVVASGTPLRLHSHCAGMDAVSTSIRKLGIRAKVVATESDPAAATFHLMHHCKTHHLVADIKWVAEGVCGPCFTHGGKMCTWDPKCDLLFSSFVCKPYSRANGKRIKTMAVDVGSDPHGVDTYHHTKTAIARYHPSAFVLENVDGVATPHPVDDSAGSTSRKRKMAPSPADFMLADLKNVGYNVIMLPSIKASETAGMCQSRPRTLFFGVRHGQAATVESVVHLFKTMSNAYKGLGVRDHIDDFLNTTDDNDVGEDVPPGSEVHGVDALFEYVPEYKKARDVLLTVFPEKDMPMVDTKDRPSASVPTEKARVRATIDILIHIHKMHTTDCSGSPGCRCHPLADVSQRADRAKWHVDGSIPTLTTGSKIFSYKLRRLLTPLELLRSMGYDKKCSLVPFPATTARTMVGNGYCVPVCAMAVAAAASVVGRIAPKIRT